MPHPNRLFLNPQLRSDSRLSTPTSMIRRAAPASPARNVAIGLLTVLLIVLLSSATRGQTQWSKLYQGVPAQTAGQSSVKQQVGKEVPALEPGKPIERELIGDQS